LEVYADELHEALTNPFALKRAEEAAQRSGRNFKLVPADGNGISYNNMALDPATLVPRAVESGALSVTSIFYGTLKSKGILELPYISEELRGNKGMRFVVDDKAEVTKRYYYHTAEVAEDILDVRPDLKQTLFYFVEEIANMFFGDTAIVDGLCDLMGNPLVWRTGLRQLLHSMPVAGYEAMGCTKLRILNSLEGAIRGANPEL
jgi:hypothetical protein